MIQEPPCGKYVAREDPPLPEECLRVFPEVLWTEITPVAVYVASETAEKLFVAKLLERPSGRDDPTEREEHPGTRTCVLQSFPMEGDPNAVRARRITACPASPRLARRRASRSVSRGSARTSGLRMRCLDTRPTGERSCNDIGDLVVGRRIMVKLAVSCGLVLVLSAPAAALDITACGQTVPAGETGVLTGDVGCALSDFVGVGLEEGATLELNGFRLGGGDNIGVHCRHRSCMISGPGTIYGGDWIAVVLEDGVRLAVNDVTISGADVGILGGATPDSHTRVNATNTVIENSLQWALSASKLLAEGFTVTGTGQNSLYAVATLSLRGTLIDVSNNDAVGIFTRKLKATNLTANGNTRVGVDARTIKLEDSTLTGNNAAGAGIDVRSLRKPRLINTTCGRSADNDGATWAVCAND